MKTSKMQSPQPSSVVVALLDVSVLSAGVIAEYSDYFDAKELFRIVEGDAWKFTAVTFQNVIASKQVNALHSAILKDATVAFGNTSSGKGKTVRVAVDVCRLAIRQGVALFDEEGKVRGRSKVQSECKGIAAKKAVKGTPAGTNDGEQKASEGETFTVGHVRQALQFLADPVNAKPFAPEILKAATAAGMRIATAAEQIILTAHYLQVKKAA
jgi:hypothetical protein